MPQFIAAVTVFLMLAACAPAPATGPAAIAVFIPGALQGSPTYQLLEAGVKKAAAEVPGTTVKTIEGGFNQAQWGEQVAGLAAGGQFRLIVTSNPAMPDLIAKVAAAYPQQKFLILESWSKNPSYATLAYNHRELAYLHGALGALLAAGSKGPPVLGLVAGQDYPDMTNAILPGFTEGARAVDSQARVEYRVVGNWYDAAKGAELAKGLYAQGATAVLTIAGGANEGVVSAAKAAGKAVLWYDIDGYEATPAVIYGSGSLKQDKGAYELVKQALAGTLVYGQPRVVGVKDGYVDYLTQAAAFQQLVPASARAKFETLLKAVRDGTTTLPLPLPDH